MGFEKWKEALNHQRALDDTILLTNHGNHNRRCGFPTHHHQNKPTALYMVQLTL